MGMSELITEISICYDYFPTAVLESILRNDLWQEDKPFLSTDAILHICDILCKRRPLIDPERRARADERWKEIQAMFLDPDEENE